MKEYTMTELFHLTRAELLRLDHEMTMTLFRLPVLSDEHTVAFTNQRCIRRELARREPTRGLGR